MLSPSPFSPSPSPLRRGAQVGNQSARKNGTFSRLQPGSLHATRTLLCLLNASLKTSSVPPQEIMQQAVTARLTLNHPPSVSHLEAFQALELQIKLNRLIARANAFSFPALRLAKGLETLARLPFIWFAGAYRDSGITRDADSFFPIPQKSALNSSSDSPTSQPSNSPASQPSESPASQLPNYSTTQLPNYSTTQLPNYSTTQLPYYPTNLTDSQWSVLAPLIPPDPYSDWLYGQPPLIIAANRWGFTLYRRTSPSHDSLVLQKYNKILARFSSPLVTRGTGSRETGTRSPGRPRTSPRLLLNAILWKLATGHSWSELPPGFPPMRLCRKYYRRLYLSGRWYTLMLALYNHFLQTSSVDLLTLLKNGVFTTTPSQKIALNPGITPTWEHYTALLFMQLARSSHSHLQRVYKQDHPFHRFSPNLKGTASLTAGLPPGMSIPEPSPKPSSRPSTQPAGSPVPQTFTGFEPPKDSHDLKEWQEKVQQILASYLSGASSMPLGPPS